MDGDRAREYGLEFVPGALSADGPTQMTPGESIDFKVEPHPMTSPHLSWTKFYRLVKPLNRPIGTAEDESDHHLDGCEYLATSADERTRGTPATGHRDSSSTYRMQRTCTLSQCPRRPGPEPATQSTFTAGEFGHAKAGAGGHWSAA